MKKTMTDIGRQSNTKPMPRRVNVRLSDRDYRKVKKAAARAGCSLAAFLRDTVLLVV